MPNYNITIDSRFDPYSFEDYLKPLAILQEQHNQAADAFATALANSAGLQDILQQNVANGLAEDQAGYDIVKGYNDSINAFADDLAKNGLNRTSRRGIYETRAKTGMIERIKKAMDNRNTYIAQQNELRGKDSSIELSDDASSHGIMRFMNPDYTYRSFSKNKITDDVSKVLKNISDSTYVQNKNNPSYKWFNSLTAQMETKYGATPEEIRQAIEIVSRTGGNTEGLNNKMKGVVNDIVNVIDDVVKSNIGDFSLYTPEQIQAAREAGGIGSWSAIGTSKFDNFHLAEPRSSGSSSSSKDDLLIDPTFVPVLTANKNTIEGFDNLQREAIDNSLSYLGGDDKTTTLYGDATRFTHGYRSPVRQVVSTKNLYDNIKKSIDANQEYFKDGKYTKAGEQALKDLKTYIREANQIYLSGDKAEKLEKLREKQSSNLSRYRVGAAGNSSTVWMTTLNTGTNHIKPLNEEEDAELKKLEAENEKLAANNESQFYSRYNFKDDKDPFIIETMDMIKRGEKLPPERIKSLNDRRKDYIANNKDVQDKEARRKRTVKIFKEAQNFFKEGATTSDIIHLTKGVSGEDAQHMWNSIAPSLRVDQLQEYLGKNVDGTFKNIGSDYKNTSDFEDLFDKNGNLQKGVQIGFDTDANGNVGYVIFDSNAEHKAAFVQADVNSKSFDYKPMLNYARALSNERAIEKELNTILASDEFTTASFNAARKARTGEQLTERERTILDRVQMLESMLNIAQQQTKVSGKEGFTNFYKQTSLKRAAYKEDVNK